MAKHSAIFGAGLSLAAVAVLALAGISIARGHRDARHAAEPSTKTRVVLAPVEDKRSAGFIGASGIAEPSSGNIVVGTDSHGTIAQILVEAGDVVERGSPLFTLETSVEEATVAERRRDLETAEAKLKSMRARAPIQKAEVDMARWELAAATAERDAARSLWEMADRLKGVMSGRERIERENAFRSAYARVERALAGIQRAEANLSQHVETDGHGGELIAVEKAHVEQARAALELAQSRLQLRTVRSPIAGTVLQLNVRLGEYASPETQQPLVIMGRTSPLYLRVDIDEADAPRWSPSGRAVATMRAANQRQVELEFVRREPLVVPKRSLSGSASERIDTRVMQVHYRIVGETWILPGQQLDVLIEVGANLIAELSSPAAGTAHATRAKEPLDAGER